MTCKLEFTRICRIGHLNRVCCSLSHNDTKGGDCHHDRCDHNDLHKHLPANPVPLVVFVFMLSIKVKWNNIDSSESLGVLSMLML